MHAGGAAPPRAQERARAEEFLGDLEAARAALEEARSCEGHDWKALADIRSVGRSGRAEGTCGRAAACECLGRMRVARMHCAQDSLRVARMALARACCGLGYWRTLPALLRRALAQWKLCARALNGEPADHGGEGKASPASPSAVAALASSAVARGRSSRGVELSLISNLCWVLQPRLLSSVVVAISYHFCGACSDIVRI